jgi:hypothetical protein
MPKLSPWTVGIHNAYSLILFGVVIAAILTGYGRSEAQVPVQSAAAAE